MPGNTDQEIISLLKKRNQKELAFNLIMDEYKERIYYYVRRLLIIHEDADDVVQDTFLKAWLALDSFRGDSSVYTWLYRIATNETISFFKKKKRFQIFSMTSIEKELENKLSNGEYFDGDKLEKKLQKAILSLPEKQRIVFNLRYYEEMKYSEMATILNTSAGALKASYHHAVKKISRAMVSV